MKASERRRKILEEAWVGDAVLSLYARRRILKETGAVDAGRLERMTSNRFLATIGEPSEVEARLGRVFEAEGLAAAFAWIEGALMPLFERQETKRYGC
ncbi:MAG: ribonuclease III domain-containing protein [Terriglobia bacterium]